MTDLVDTYIENRHLVQPENTNTHETAHGGEVMKWMDTDGALSAMRFAERTCVTARMDRVDFIQSIPLGQTCLIQAYVYDAGETSIRVRLRAFRENPRTGESELTTQSYSVYVGIDEDHDPARVPDLTVSTDRGADLREAALDGVEDE